MARTKQTSIRYNRMNLPQKPVTLPPPTQSKQNDKMIFSQRPDEEEENSEKATTAKSEDEQDDNTGTTEETPKDETKGVPTGVKRAWIPWDAAEPASKSPKTRPMVLFLPTQLPMDWSTVSAPTSTKVLVLDWTQSETNNDDDTGDHAAYAKDFYGVLSGTGSDINDVVAAVDMIRTGPVLVLRAPTSAAQWLETSDDSAAMETRQEAFSILVAKLVDKLWCGKVIILAPFSLSIPHLFVPIVTHVVPVFDVRTVDDYDPSEDPGLSLPENVPISFRAYINGNEEVAITADDRHIGGIEFLQGRLVEM